MIGNVGTIPRVALNGFGRIARAILRAAVVNSKVDIIFINEPSLAVEQMAYLLKFDSIHGVFPYDVRYSQEVVKTPTTKYKSEPYFLFADLKRIRVFEEKDPSYIPWESEGIDFVIECGSTDPEKYIKAGVSRVIIPASPKDAGLPVFIKGVNHEKYRSVTPIMFAGDSALNCLAPMAKILQDNFSVKEGLVTCIEGITEFQQILDNPTKNNLNWRLGRAGSFNIIPDSLDAIKSLERLHPPLKNKFAGISVKVHSPGTSLMDLSLKFDRPIRYIDICKVMKTVSEDKMEGIIGYTEQAVVSQDFINDTRSCIFDAGLGIMLTPQTVKLMAWYNQEWALAWRVLELINYMKLIDSI